MPPTAAAAATATATATDAMGCPTATQRAPPGALACQRDSALRALRARVTRCERVRLPATKKTPAQSFLEVELLDTVLFPEGGGQPCDTGALDGARVDKVFIRDGRCLHRVPLPAGEEEADGELARALQEGTEVLATVDWDRRFDHMQQHSAQHLLSAVAERHGYDTTTWSLGDERCNVELVPVGGTDKPQKVSEDVLRRIESEVNAAIVRGLEMTPKFAQPGSPEWEQVARKFPADQQPEAMRIVCIDGIDANPCCGTHVKNVAQLQVRLCIVGGRQAVLEMQRLTPEVVAAVAAPAQRRVRARGLARVVRGRRARQPRVLAHVRRRKVSSISLTNGLTG